MLIAPQTLVAISHVTKEIISQHEHEETNPMDADSMLVLSLGTGAPKVEEKYNAPIASSWGPLGWLLDNGASPLLDIYFHASSDMVDIHISTLFQFRRCHNNYLRIQVINRTVYTFFLVLSRRCIGLNLCNGRRRMIR